MSKVQPVLVAPNVLAAILERLESVHVNLVDPALHAPLDIAAELVELREIIGTLRSWL